MLLVLLFGFLLKQDRKKLLLITLIPLTLIVAISNIQTPFYVPSPSGNYKISADPKIANRLIEKYIDAGLAENYHVSITQNTRTRIDGLTFNEGAASVISIKKQLEARGYLRVLQFPEYLLLGAGQGGEKRFSNYLGNHYEIHSSDFSILFYYGIFGFFLFFKSIFNLFNDFNRKNMLLLIPIFTYGLFTYGLRAPYFWAFLGVLSVVPEILKRKSLIR